MPVAIEQSSQNLLNHIIAKKSFLNNYPKEGVVFLAIDPLFKDSRTKKIIADSVLAATNSLPFDYVAGIASRGYVFSGLVANQFNHKGEQFIQKVKVKGDKHFIQLETKTEYSSDELQVLKGTIEKDKTYLVTDDLVATGGSLLSSIQLIRDSGGLVNTAFVMTELVDFNARELLKKAGVELVSLLKFTNKDLQKVLEIQDTYDKSKSATISYNLSHHKGELSPECSVHVASNSKLKKNAAQLAVQEILNPLCNTMVGHDVSSGVSNQPFSYDETVKGSLNRLAAIGKEIKDDKNVVLVSVENGLRYAEDEDKYYDFVHVVTEKNNKRSTYAKDCCVVPKEIIQEIDPLHQTTWGEIAKSKGLAKSHENPHKEAIFGGVSREVHIHQALNQSLKKLTQPKNELMTIQRLAKLNSHRSYNHYAKRGILFANPIEQKPQNAINLYTQGYPEKAKQNNFKIFDTGDVFAVISPEVEFNNANVNIHVGIEHKKYSQLVLLHEALQICRCSHEHGAKEIVISLPEQYHPILNPNDFNILLINLFKVSGASSIYFHDKKYQDELSKNSEPLSCNKDPVLQYLQWNPQGSLDEKVAHHMRKHAVKRVLSQCEMKQTVVDKLLSEDASPANIRVPAETKPQHVLLCCSSNQPFAKEIAKSLKARGESVKVYSIEGKGKQAKIPSNAKIHGATVTIVQSTRPNPEDIDLALEYKINGASAYLFEAIMIARQAHMRGAQQVNLVNPYQFGARSDKAEKNIKGKTGSYVQLNGLLLEAAGVNHVITAECHDPHTLSGTYTGKKIQGSAVQALTIITKGIAEKWLQSSHEGQFRLVTPDAGAAKRTKELTQTLQAILKNKLCDSRILGEKDRGSHKDDSALISNLNAGSIHVNTHDKYLITDDETATGSTLCQAVQSLKTQGAKDISVVIVHNNMPVNWLLRQLSLARFIYLGVNDLHFSNTQEMGALAKSYDNLIKTYSQMTLSNPAEIEAEVLKWFKGKLTGSFDSFKESFNQISARVTVHNLSEAFVDEFSPKKKTQLEHHPQSAYITSNLFSSSYKSGKEISDSTQQTTLTPRA